VVPLLAAAVVALGAGLLSAHLFLRAQMEISLHPPGPAFYVVVVAGVAADGSATPIIRDDLWRL
jgi:hypothetical protein